jgi:hypothetical protein
MPLSLLFSLGGHVSTRHCAKSLLLEGCAGAFDTLHDGHQACILLALPFVREDQSKWKSAIARLLLRTLGASGPPLFCLKINQRMIRLDDN